jgi:hypothetical protein
MEVFYTSAPDLTWIAPLTDTSSQQNLKLKKYLLGQHVVISLHTNILP